jgi:hypothetical protein
MKLVVKIALGVILAVIVLVAGCAVLIGKAAKDAGDAITKKHHYALTVRCSCAWQGSAGGSSYDGHGTKTIRFKDLAITAADAQKQDGGHEPLTLTLRDGSKVLDHATTTAAYGVATVSGSNF